MDFGAWKDWRRIASLLSGRSGGGRSADRYRRALWTTLATGMAKAGGMVSMLVLVPVMIRHLGNERAGVWLTMSSLTVLVGFADLGMGTGLMTRVARAMGAQREDEARQAISSCFFVLFGLAAGATALFVLVNPWVPWPSILNSSPDLMAAELTSAMLAFVVATLAGLPFSIVERVQSGKQEGFSGQLWQGGATLVSMAGVLVAVGFGLGLTGVVWVGTGIRTLMLAANWYVYFRRQRPALCPRWAESSRAVAWEMVRLGVVFLWLNVLAYNWWMVDPLVITRTLGPDAVTGYAALQRLFMVALVAQYLVIPLWPAFGEALARGDREWVRVALRRSLLGTVTLTAALGLGLVVFGAWICRHWLGSEFVPSAAMLMGMALLNVLLVIAWNLSGVLVHGAYLRRQAGLYTVAALLALILKVALIRVWGLPGVVWGSVFAFGFIYTPMAFRLAAEAVGRTRVSTTGNAA